MDYSQNSERVLHSRINQLEEQLAIRNSEYHQLSSQALSTTQKLEQHIANLESEKAQMISKQQKHAYYSPNEDQVDELRQTIQALNDQLIETNNELLEVHEQQEEVRKTQLYQNNVEDSFDIDEPMAKSKVQCLEEDMELMRTAMAQEEERKLEDKDELNMLRDENEELKTRVNLLEDQIRQVNKLFGGLGNICTGAQERLESLLSEGTMLNLTVGESHFAWK